MEHIGKENPNASVTALPWDTPEFTALITGLDDIQKPPYNKPGRSTDQGFGHADDASAGEITTGHGDRHDHNHDEHGGTDNSKFRSITFIVPDNLSAQTLRDKLTILTGDKKIWANGNIIRMKGIISTSDRGAVTVDWAHGSVGIEPTALAADGTLVVIGRDIPEKYLIKLLGMYQL